jgi:hypothetical protein
LADDQVRKSLARLEALAVSLSASSTSYPERYVLEFNTELEKLSSSGVAVDDFAIRPHDLGRIMTGGNYATGETHASTELHVEGPILRSRLAGVLAYLRPTVSEGDVSFADGSIINITTVTVERLVRELAKQIEAKVHDPEARRVLLGRISDVLKHPASTTVLQTTLSEILKAMSDAG